MALLPWKPELKSCNAEGQIEATSIGGRRSDFFTAEKLALGNLGLLQQKRHFATRAIGFGGTAETRTLGLSVQSIGKLEWRRAMVTEGSVWP